MKTIRSILLLVLATAIVQADQPAPAPDPSGQLATYEHMYVLVCQQRDQATRLAYDFQIQAQIAQQENTSLRAELADLKVKLAGLEHPVPTPTPSR